MHRISVQYSGPADGFESRYTEGHVPLVLALPGLARFTTSRTRALGPGEVPDFVAELWFEDAETMKAAMRSPEMAATAADAEELPAEGFVMFTGEVHEHR
ncbi:EthD family reductase [Nocardioides mangrovicus]|nr:EthD family reductase [Nocardioides mangrovicus]